MIDRILAWAFPHVGEHYPPGERQAAARREALAALFFIVFMAGTLFLAALLPSL